MIVEETYQKTNLKIANMSLYDLFNENSEKDFMSLLKLACFVSDCKNAAITFIKDNLQVVRYTKGDLEPVVLKLSDSICKYTVQNDGLIQIPHLQTDHRFKDLIHNTNFPFNFYAGLKFITSDGDLQGTLCLFDSSSKILVTNQIEALEDVSNQIVNILNLRKKNLKGIQDKEENEDFKILFNSSPDLICILDENQRILNINNASETILGISPADCLGVNISKFVFPEDRVHVLETANKALLDKQKSFEVETRLKSQNGVSKWISWNAVTKNRIWFIIGREITKQKQLIKSLNQLSAVVSKINNGIVISNPNNNVIWVNNAFTTITGYTLEDLESQKLGDVIIGANSDIDIIEKAREETQNKKSFSVELLAYRKDGIPIWLSIFNSVILDKNGEIESLVEVIIDITSRKYSEERLELLSLVASKTENGVAINDKFGKVKWVNNSLEKLYGYSLKELENKRIGDLVKGIDTDVQKLKEARETAKNYNPYNIELKVYKKDRTPIWVSVSNTPVFDDKGKINHQVEIINDISERKKVEEQLLASKEQAIQLSKAKEMFLSVMSHEIRTPLNAIIGLTNILSDEEQLEDQKQSIKLLKFSSDNLLNLINDILDFSKIEVGKMELENKRLSIYELIKDIADSLSFKIKEKGIELKYKVDANIPNLVRGDKTRLYQILINLINNAIKFTEAGFVEVVVTLISVDNHYSRLKFEVIDTGIGIPEDKFDYIFESFTQAATNTTRKYGGSGLGLSITKKLIELYNGSIKVISELGRGTTFEFDLRFNNFVDTDIVESQVHKKLEAKILVVDDNEINRLLAKRVLAKFGLEVVSADSGYQAIELLQSKDFDLVLMDVHMPDLSGYETVKKLRENKDKYFYDLPIIALTASILKDDIGEINENGMIDYQLKPFKPEELYDKIVKHIKK